MLNVSSTLNDGTRVGHRRPTAENLLRFTVSRPNVVGWFCDTVVSLVCIHGLVPLTWAYTRRACCARMVWFVVLVFDLLYV